MHGTPGLRGQLCLHTPCQPARSLPWWPWVAGPWCLPSRESARSSCTVHLFPQVGFLLSWGVPHLSVGPSTPPHQPFCTIEHHKLLSPVRIWPVLRQAWPVSPSLHHIHPIQPMGSPQHRWSMPAPYCTPLGRTWRRPMASASDSQFQGLCSCLGSS